MEQIHLSFSKCVLFGVPPMEDNAPEAGGVHSKRMPCISPFPLY